MHQRHHDTIINITDRLKADQTVLAVIVGGSIAHGYASESSDVDIMVIIPEEEYQQKYKNKTLTFYISEPGACDVDGKYTTVGFLESVAQRGSEASRYAFEGAIVTYSKIDGLRHLIDRITRYPIEEKTIRMKHFYFQLKTWQWLYNEGNKRSDPYLTGQAVSNIVFYSGRLMLAYNETLYPYHKWFMKVLESVPVKPPGMAERIRALLDGAGAETVNQYCDEVFQFTDWQIDDAEWTDYDLKYEEQNWLSGGTRIAAYL